MIDTVDCRSSSTADILNILEDFKGQQVKLEYFSWFGTVGSGFKEDYQEKPVLKEFVLGGVDGDFPNEALQKLPGARDGLMTTKARLLWFYFILFWDKNI